MTLGASSLGPGIAHRHLLSLVDDRLKSCERPATFHSYAVEGTERLLVAESNTPKGTHTAAIEDGRPSVGTKAASNDRLRFPSARRFQERRRPRYPGTSRSIPAWSGRAAVARLEGS